MGLRMPWKPAKPPGAREKAAERQGTLVRPRLWGGCVKVRTDQRALVTPEGHEGIGCAWGRKESGQGLEGDSSNLLPSGCPLPGL